MKVIKIFIVLFIFLGGCYLVYHHSDTSNEEKTNMTMKEEEETRAIFISYIDYSSYLKGKDINTKKNNIDMMISNVKEFQFNTIILQVRPFFDAIYKSNFYKPSTTITESEDDILNFDILSYFIEVSKKNNIKIHAWINPYRIRNTSDITTISKSSKVYDWLDTDNLEISDKGIYLNPASSEVLDYILKGINELVSNYDIDGIMYDDYFYPNKTIDLDSYAKYKGEGGNLSIEEYRINNITNLIKKSYLEVKSIKKDVLFGISPAGNIENNLNNEYLDIKTILNEGIYLDYVMPQMYYGFFNQTKPFQETLNNWDKLITNNNVKLYPALSLYKAGIEDKYAGSGSNEWIENDDIIKKQIIISRNKKNYGGFSIFRYEHLFNEKKQNTVMKEEVSNIKLLIKES